MCDEEKTPDFTAADVRFSSRGRTFYAIVLDWPENSPELVIKSLNTNDALLAKDEIANLTLLGSDQKLAWRHDGEGLEIKLPPEKPGNFAYTSKILLK